MLPFVILQLTWYNEEVNIKKNLIQNIQSTFWS